MKKIFAIILALMCILALAGCQNLPADNDTPPGVLPSDGNVTFIAQVLEVHAGSYLIQPVEGSAELNSADKITVPAQDGVNAQVGDYIKVTYDGQLMESYPAQIHRATIELYTGEVS